MKILLAAPQDKTVLGVVASHCKKALEELGNEVSVFDFRRHPYAENWPVKTLKNMIRPFFPRLPSPYEQPAIKASTDKKINTLLYGKAASFKPDLLLVLCGENISSETILRLKHDLGITSANWFHDTLLSEARQELIFSVLPVYDYLFIVDDEEVLKQINVNFRRVSTLPLACDPAIHKHLDLSIADIRTYGSDVAFVGTLTPERESILESLAEFDLKIWGIWAKKSKRLAKCYQRQNISSFEAAKVYNAAKIVIDIHTLFGRVNKIFNVTPRVFEVPASGGFLLTNDCVQVRDFYNVPQEMVVYGNISELKEMIRYYLGHPEERAAIVSGAKARVKREHTYLNRMRSLLDTIKGRS
ncbi:MAG: glycosyltransferase [Candidatus Omnitrophica bacterium]|nr:glycosyltransferase [Candidatus Omnitrophota bacterium]MDD5237325.1 glycosyltransferase [Candidatus Omnitrophota bacterium]MDD5610517.1 glycosyltransferase [Candidatus Omnitrophota bacterium]